MHRSGSHPAPPCQLWQQPPQPEATHPEGGHTSHWEGQWQVRAELRPSVTAPGEQFDCYDSLGGDGGGGGSGSYTGTSEMSTSYSGLSSPEDPSAASPIGVPPPYKREVLPLDLKILSLAQRSL